MKLFLTLAITAVSAVSLFAGSIPRTDINAHGKIELEPETVENGLKITHQGWGPKESRAYRLTAAASKTIGDKWTLCKFAFTPKADGKVNLSVGGQWAKKVEDRGWLAVSDIKVNGKLIPNGDFSKTVDKKGKTIPSGFWLSKNAAYAAKGGPDGANAVIVNHDNRIGFGLKVEAGKTVTVEYMAKSVAAPAVKAAPAPAVKAAK